MSIAKALLSVRKTQLALAKNERQRERVISDSDLEKYFRHASQPCRDVALLIVKEGTRPDEVFTLDWRNVELGASGMIHIRWGKTKNAKRDLPLTAETHHALLRRFEEQGRPQEGWVFRAPTKSGHIEESSIRKQHLAAIAKAGLEHFELYCFRHTFLTILGASGCDPYTLCRIAGHGDIKMAMRYCHTQNEYIVNAFCRLAQFRQKGVTTGGYRQQLPSSIEPTALAATASQSES